MSDLKWNGDIITARLQAAMRQATTNAAELVLDESNRRVPLETGELMRSGRVIKARGTYKLTARIRYGGGTVAAYAVRQHEDLTLKHPNGREAKFLERAAQERAAVVARLLRDAARNGG